MPLLNLSELNIVLTVGGVFLSVFGYFSHALKEKWFVGEALPSVVAGIIAGPLAGRFLEPGKLGGYGEMFDDERVGNITLGVCRVVIGIQLVIAGFQLPKQYIWERKRDMAIVLMPLMLVMWLSTSACVLLVIPKITFLSALVIGSCVTCTDPVLSQAVAKGAFADKYVPRRLREIISAEAGANDGFGFPFLMLAIYIMRYTNNADVDHHPGEHGLGALGGGTSLIIKDWFLETVLYLVIMSVFIGAIIGIISAKLLRFAVKRELVETDCYLSWGVALGMINLGVCGLIGTDDLLACFISGCFLNWDGAYHAEALARHDEVNSSFDMLLNLGGFMYIGAVMPWSTFHDPTGTGITWPLLCGVGALVLLLRRIPGMLLVYKLMPDTVKTWKDALFMGYFGPIGIGAVFYAEHVKHLLPHPPHGDSEERALLAAIVPVVYFLALASIVVHGLSIPILNYIYHLRGVDPVQDDISIRRRKSHLEPVPANATTHKNSLLLYNRFHRPGTASASVLEQEGCVCAIVDGEGRVRAEEWGEDDHRREFVPDVVRPDLEEARGTGEAGRSSTSGRGPRRREVKFEWQETH